MSPTPQIAILKVQMAALSELETMITEIKWKQNVLQIAILKVQMAALSELETMITEIKWKQNVLYVGC